MPVPSGVNSAKRMRTLIWLILVFALNYLDRQVMSLFAQPIKVEFHLSDMQIGLLYGLGFSILYGLASFPMARWADRGNRSRIVNLALFFFSLMTAFCAAATGFWQLLAARVGVALGESGTNPPSHSLISDLFAPRERSVALAAFSVGPNIGILFGFLVLGWIGGNWGWRAAFLTVGLLGVVVGFAGVFIEEPKRSDKKINANLSILEALNKVFETKTARHVYMGAMVFTLTTFCLLGWIPSLLIREGLSVSSTGLALALINGLAGGCGTFLGGVLTERLAKGDASKRLRILSLVLLLAAPAWTIVLLCKSPEATVVAMIVPGAALSFFLGPTFATVQSLVAPSIRATAAAALVFSGVIGLGIGPFVVGALSDALSTSSGANSLRYAMFIAVPLCMWASTHYYLASKTANLDVKD